MAPQQNDYYKTLEISRDANKDEIAKAYKKLAKKYHPDLNPGDKVAEDRFKEITEAYEVLKDADKRKMYDQLGSDWEHASQFRNAGGFGGFGNAQSFNFQDFESAGFGSVFDTIFGSSTSRQHEQDIFGQYSHPQRGRDIETEVSIPLELAVTGGKQTVTLHSGVKPRTLEINIPAGVKEGAKLRLSGQGHPGPQSAGDLYLRIRFAPHASFTVEEQNLIYEARISPWTAVLGGKIRVPTLDGEVNITIPAGSGSGRKMRLRGKGLGKAETRGDLMVQIGIDVPQQLSDEERTLWTGLAQLAEPKEEENHAE